MSYAKRYLPRRYDFVYRDVLLSYIMFVRMTKKLDQSLKQLYIEMKNILIAHICPFSKYTPWILDIRANEN